MGRFSELGTYKSKIIQKLISDDNIVRAIGISQKNFLDKNITPPEPHSLIYNNIYPYAYIPEAEDLMKTYITIMFNNFQLNKTFYKVGDICFYVFCHFSLQETNYAILRSDYLINQIDEVFNRTHDLGIGSLQFNGMGDIKVSKYHFGSYIRYKDFSFN